MNNELYQLLLSGKIGDGCFITQTKKSSNKRYYFLTNSINSDYIKHKQDIFTKNGIFTRKLNCSSGYKKTSKIYGFSTNVISEVTEIGNMNIEDVLDNLDLKGLIYYYLDDGTLHKHKHFMHIYCNTFSEHEANKLIELLYKYYPIKKCKLAYDRKKDGRIFPYIRIPVPTAREFSKDIRKFLIDNNINSLLYKTVSPSQTIENIE